MQIAGATRWGHWNSIRTGLALSSVPSEPAPPPRPSHHPVDSGVRPAVLQPCQLPGVLGVPVRYLGLRRARAAPFAQPYPVSVRDSAVLGERAARAQVDQSRPQHVARHASAQRAASVSVPQTNARRPPSSSRPVTAALRTLRALVVPDACRPSSRSCRCLWPRGSSARPQRACAMLQATMKAASFVPSSGTMYHAGDRDGSGQTQELAIVTGTYIRILAHNGLSGLRTTEAQRTKMTSTKRRVKAGNHRRPGTIGRLRYLSAVRKGRR